MSETRAQRQAALEERRRRIAELRDARSRRVEDTARVHASATSNLDDYVTGLLNEPAPIPVSLSSVSDTESANEAVAPSKLPENNNALTLPVVGSDDSDVAEITPAPPRAPPKTVETFTLGTQTDPTEFDETLEEEDTDLHDRDGDKSEKRAEAQDAATTADKNERDKQPKLLADVDVVKEVSSTEFSSFLNTASKKVERVLGTSILSDLLVDNVGEALATSADDHQQLKDASKFISNNQVYECHKWTAGREVTDIDWSPLHRDLVLSTYHQHIASAVSGSSSANVVKANSTAISAIGPHDTPSDSMTPRSGELQSDGLALVWSLSMPKRPEHIFTCGSPVTVGRFHPTDPTLVVGGCESGQIVVWDVRAGRLPVQKSALVVGSNNVTKGHTHPIGCMAVLEGGAGFVTSSTDGKVNFWSLSNLREPAESLQIGDSVSAFAVAPESGALLLGDDNGALYTIPSAGSSGQRRAQRQVRKLETADAEGENLGHYGLITSLATKTVKKGGAAAQAKGGFFRGSGGLVLSSGVDWTVKLWAPADRDTPLTSFVSHSYDYMSDVKWNPVHPGLFATASSNGTVGLWNLALSLDEPISGAEGIVVDAETVDSSLSGQSGINKLSWSLDGRRVAVASSSRLHILNLTEEVTRSGKTEEDGKKMMNQLVSRGWISSRQ